MRVISFVMPTLGWQRLKTVLNGFDKLNRNPQLSIIVVLGLIFVFLKLKGFNVSNTLWAEDGRVFINQAREYGIYSIWEPYAGYFHVYPRLIAWISYFFDLPLTPIVFFIGWILAYTSLIYIAANRALNLGLSATHATLISILLVAQPHSGEAFFNLTNAQWFTGAALAIYLLIPVKDTSSILEKLIVFIASLTGPFALLLTPVLFVQLIVYKDWKSRKFIYVTVLVAATIQLVAILLSSRLGKNGFDTNITHWLTVIYTFFTFGKKSLIPQLAALFFWVTTIWAFVLVLPTELLKNVRQRYEAIEITSLVLVMSAGVFFLAGLVAAKTPIQDMSPIGSGARYFFIPYVLIFLAAVLITSKRPKLLSRIYASLIVLVISTFSVFKGSDLQFNAFVEFAKQKSDVLIPIRPERQWNIFLYQDQSQEAGHMHKPVPLSISSAGMYNIVNQFNDTKHFKATSSTPYFIFDIRDKCRYSKYIGVEFSMPLHEGAIVEVSLENKNNVVKSQSLRRYATSEDTIVHFALPMSNATHLRFYPSDKVSDFRLDSAKLYCL